jgi:hypothetical protein
MIEFNTDKQALLDLLVDGEIDEAQRRDLLAWCEREPDGWRRCALAFLEAQSWSKVLGDLSDERVSQRGELVPAAPPSVSRPQSFWNRRNWGTMLAMAASVVLAFTLGLQLRDAERAGEMSAPQPSLRVVDSQARTTPTATLLGQPEQGPASARLVGGGQTPDEIQVPVVAGDQFGSGLVDGGWLLSQPSALPDDVRRTLERMGHRVEQQRRLVPYRLGDGSRLVVPVDQVEVRPVGDESSQ